MPRKQQHTPAPWNVDKNFKNIVDSDYNQIICCYLKSSSVKENIAINRANARLIAAAPELLEALINLLEAERTQDPFNERGEEAAGWDAMVEAKKETKAAIKKATIA